MRKTFIGATAGVLLATTLAAGFVPATVSRAAAPDAPNVIFILTDDQRIDSMQTMQAVRRLIADDGQTFTGVVPTSLCCPSRTSILTGRYSHSTGVYRNQGTHGGWPTFHNSGLEAHTLAVALHDDGYRTALFGKYLNGWPLSPQDFVPPGWDDFMGIRKDDPKNPELGSGAYYDYTLTGTEPTEAYGHSPSDYSTDVLADKAVNFVQDHIDGGPLFMMLTPSAPHAPYTPAPRHIGTFHPDPYRNEAVNERNMSDKPTFYHDLRRVPRQEINTAQERTGEALRAVDEAVARIVAATGDEESNTLFIFMSDNGVLWGEHRLTGKNLPYRWATEVPFIMRWDGHISPGSTGELAANIDVAPTILEAAGIPNALPVEGISLLSQARSEIGLEAMRSNDRPAYCGVRTVDQLFIQYNRRVAVELYDYKHDPLELSSRGDKSSAQDEVKRLRKEAKSLCDPVPPDFSWQRHLRP